MSDLLDASTNVDATIDAAVSSMLEEQEAPAQAAPFPAPETQPTESAATAAAESAPAEKPASVEGTEGEVAPAAPASIEPPKFWSADQREQFAKLPADLQAYVKAQAEEASRVVSQRLAEAAEKSKAAEFERQQLAAQLGQFIPAHMRAFQTEFADVLSGQKALAQLSHEDPARYTRFAAMRDEINAAVQQQQAIQQQSLAQRLVSEEQALLSKVPEWRDPAKGKAELDSLRQEAVKRYGFDPREVQTIADHRYALILRDAAAYHKLLAAQKTAVAQKVVQAPPKVQKPGTGETKKGGSDALLQRARAGDLSLHDRADAVAAYLSSLGELG